MKKTIWVLWLQGFDNAPRVVLECLRSWKFHNADTWNVIELCERNLDDYVDLNTLIEDIGQKQITRAALSDLVRIELLRRYGGLWVDATTFCTKPLDSWLGDYTSEGFFAFAFAPGRDRLLSSWFLYGDKPSIIIDRWHDAVLEYVRNRQSLGAETAHESSHEWSGGIPHRHYFWFHYLFGDCVTRDQHCSAVWHRMAKVDSDQLHLILRHGLMNPPSDELKEIISSRVHPLYKLTYRYDEARSSATVLDYLFDSYGTGTSAAAAASEPRGAGPKV